MDAILEAAVRVLGQHGAAGLTTRRVADVAGVSVGSFYQYFPNKEAVLAELVRRRVDGLVSVLEAACAAATGGVVEASAGVIRAFLDEKRRYMPVSRVLGPALVLVEGRRIMAEGAQRLHAVFAAMLERAGRRPLTAGERTRLAVALSAVEGAVANAVEHDPSRFADPEFEDALLGLFLGAFGWEQARWGGAGERPAEPVSDRVRTHA